MKVLFSAWAPRGYTLSGMVLGCVLLAGCSFGEVGGDRGSGYLRERVFEERVVYPLSQSRSPSGDFIADVASAPPPDYRIYDWCLYIRDYATRKVNSGFGPWLYRDERCYHPWVERPTFFWDASLERVWTVVERPAGGGPPQVRLTERGSDGAWGSRDVPAAEDAALPADVRAAVPAGFWDRRRGADQRMGVGFSS